MRRALTLAVAVALAAFLLALAWPRLPAGVCYHDAGDLQTAAVTLGIAHPPGYAGYVALGHLASRCHPANPARGVTLLCTLATILALAALLLIMLELGADLWLSAAVVALAATWPALWRHLVLPEVYGPTLALVGWSVWLLLRAERGRRAVPWLLAGLLLGLAAANRPPVLLTLGLLAAGGAIRFWRRRPGRRRVLTAVGWTLAGLAVGPAWSLGYLLARDRPQTAYNYVERYARETGRLPPTDAGLSARWQRIWWLASAHQYRGMVAGSLAGLHQRLAWLASRCVPPAARWPLAVAAVVALPGLITLARRRPETLLLLAAPGLGTLAFLAYYQVADDAADVAPLAWSITALLGTGLGRALLWQPLRRLTRATWALAILCATLSWYQAGRLPAWGRLYDAGDYLAGVELEALPAGSVVLAAWNEAPPLSYDLLVRGRGPGVQLVVAPPSRWFDLGRSRAAESSVFFANPVAVPAGWQLRPEHGLWRLLPTTGPPEPAGRGDAD